MKTRTITATTALKIRRLYALPLLLALTLTAWGFSSGPPDGLAGDPPINANCTLCHNSFPVNSGSGVVQLTGLPQTYQPGSVYTFTLTIQQAGQQRWGFEMTSILSNWLRGGQLAPGNPSFSQISMGSGNARDYLKHTSLGTQAGQNSGSWEITWTAPPAGSDTVYFYISGNAANNNGSNSGDYIYTISAALPEFVNGISGAPEIPPEIPSLLAVYPNPFNPSVTVDLSGWVGRGALTLQLSDISGRIIRNEYYGIVRFGEMTRLPLDLNELPAGTYFLRAVQAENTAVTKLVKVK
jgi:hypothetical protein